MRTAIVKVHSGESGWGLQLFNHSDPTPPVIDACVATLRQLFATDVVWSGGPYIVEEYIDHDHRRPGVSPSGEATVTESSVHFDYLCDQLIDMNGVFLGVRIGKSVEASPFADQLRSQTLAVGRILQNRAYRGTYDVDFIIDHNDQIFAVESNVRLTGGTHVYCAAQHVFGDRWRQLSFVSNDAIRYLGPPLPAGRVLDLLDDLLLRKPHSAGIIVSFVSSRHPIIGAIGVGPSDDEAAHFLVRAAERLHTR